LLQKKAGGRAGGRRGGAGRRTAAEQQEAAQQTQPVAAAANAAAAPAAAPVAPQPSDEERSVAERLVAQVVDDDCDPSTRDDDFDGDGFGASEDCDDDDAAINPDAEEEPYTGVDEDCSSRTPDDDLDGDGFDLADDCDDTNDAIYPGADEDSTNGDDDDCDGTIDERFDFETVDSSADMGLTSTLDVDSSGSVLIAYLESTTGVVWSVEGEAGAWSTPEEVLNESGVYVGEYMDGTFDSADQFHLGFTWQDSLGRILTYQVRDAADTSRALEVFSRRAADYAFVYPADLLPDDPLQKALDPAEARTSNG
jgi:hypothetical protein